MTKIQDLPKHKRPREKLSERGAESLSDAELLAILIRTGRAGKSALDIAKEALKKYPLSKLLAATQKELIAIGISVVIDCESCMEWHIKQALDDGATENEIIESIEVGIEMSGGPGTASARFAMNVLEYYQNK